MKKTLIFLICILWLTPLISQNYLTPIDSTIASFQLSDEDWVIGLTIHQDGIVPIFDSLGNILDGDANGLYIISQINKQCELLKFESHYSENMQGYKVKLNRQIKISDSSICIYTKDSIQKAENEWIYPNVYLNDSLKVYNVQQNGDHSPFYRICFRTKQSIFYSSFGEIDVFNSQRHFGFFLENLNDKYNSSTFIYRAFINYITLLKKHFKIQVLL